MPAAPVTLPSTALTDWRPRISGTLVSVLLHVLAAYLLLTGPWKQTLPPEPETMVVEMVTLPEPPAPPAIPQTLQPDRPPAPPPEIPQLQEAPIAERSSPPPPPVARPARPPAPSRADDSSRAPPTPRTAPLQPTEEAAQSAPFQSGRFRPESAPPSSEASQAVQDFILQQIKRHWIIDFRGPRFRNIQLYGRFVLLPDGMLAPPFGKNDPWNLRAMIGNYDELTRPGTDQSYRIAVETFLQAVRQAQPFRMPPDGRGDVPRNLPLSFLLGSL